MSLAFRPFVLAALASAAALLSACGGGGGAPGDGGGIGGTGGTMRFAMTDAPACGFDAVNVTVERVAVHAAPSAQDADGGWQELVVSPPQRLDLLTLTNGVLAPLGAIGLPAGRYTQLRLVLADNSAGDPLANSVVPSGGTEQPLATPSAQQSGLKLRTAIDVAPGQVADVVLDFDACRSVVRRGNSGRYNLKPVVSAIPVVSEAGQRITGHVPAGTAVSVQRDGVVVKSTVPEARTGRFVLAPVPAGTYDLVVTAPGRATLVLTGVPVTAEAPTTLPAAALPLTASSPMRDVTGTVAPASSTVRVLQPLSGGRTVEVAAAPVDADTGAFSVAVPTSATVRAAYGSPAPFTADAGTAGRYVVEAASAGAVKTATVNATAPVPPLSFVFP